MPGHIARSRTIPSRDRVRRPLGTQPHAGRREPAAADPVSGDPVWLGCFKGKNVFLITENAFFSWKNHSKSILSPKITKPFPENF
jgi:hypothetical protein